MVRRVVLEIKQCQRRAVHLVGQVIKSSRLLVAQATNNFTGVLIGSRSFSGMIGSFRKQAKVNLSIG